MRDRRLLGVWRSDKRQTLRELQARRGISKKSQQVIGRLLGKLELRFTETRCYSTLDGHTSSAPYMVVAKDSSSVAIVSRDALLGEDTISHTIEMAWQGKTLGEICRQMTDLGRNGGRTLDEVVHHMAEDSLVGWAWSPGAGREPAPGSQSAFGALIRAWAKSGAACPAR
jgi:hypothetical protein